MPGTAFNLVCVSASVRGGEASAERARRHLFTFAVSKTCVVRGRTVTVAPVSSVAGGTLALEGLALQRDALGRGVAVVVPSVARVDQLRLCCVHCRGEEKTG